MLYVAVLDGEQRVFDPLEDGPRLLHGGDVYLLVDEAHTADRADHHRCARAEHFEQLECKN